MLRAVIRRLRRRRARLTEPAAHIPGRAHLVFSDGTVLEAELAPADRARAAYLARRAVAPPPPD